MGGESPPYKMAKLDKFITKHKDLLALNPKIGKVITERCWDFLSESNDATKGHLGDLWEKNVRKNIKAGLWDKYGGIHDDLRQFGFNKALIAVGGGPSFNKNKHILKRIVDSDGVKGWEDRDFYVVASNHQYKPLLEEGIIPDFVTLADASEVVFDQLCVDVPKSGRNTVMLTGLHSSPKVLKEWTKQGRDIRFYINRTVGQPELFKKMTHKNPEPYSCIAGGNVLNTIWSLSMRYLGSTVFIAVGNDLCFPVKDDVEDQRATFYADGNYSANAPKTGTGRDEARSPKRWMGINGLEKSKIIIDAPTNEHYNIDIGVQGVPLQFWTYKTWMESQIMIHEAGPRPFHYFNCTEGGTLGVLNKDPDNVEKNYKDIDSWYLMDEMTKRYHTAMLEDAAVWFVAAKARLKHARIDAPSVTSLGNLISPITGAHPAIRKLTMGL